LLIYLSKAYAEIVYGHGEMNDARVIAVASVAAIGLSMLPLQGLATFLTAVFNSRRDMRTPMLLNGVGLLFFLLVNSIGLFGNGLPALMWAMVASYALICGLQLMTLKIESFRWLDVLFEKTFFIGIVCAISISIVAGEWISEVDLSAWLSITLACVAALLSLLVMALLNEKLRFMMKSRLMTK
jgi:peptidoglycan biosynthesis protein MviN/MurJ (putative lipid II flippase)